MVEGGENWHSSHMLSPPILRSTEAGGGWGGENWHSSLMFNLAHPFSGQQRQVLVDEERTGIPRIC